MKIIKGPAYDGATGKIFFWHATCCAFFPGQNKINTRLLSGQGFF
jgi:hypothetical protein